MDHMMPELDGVETTRRIRALGYGYPIVALTANAVSGQAEMFLKNGFDEFISKPIDIRQMNTVLNRFVRDKQPPEIIEAARSQSWDNNEKSISTANKLLLESFARDARKAIAILDGIDIENDLKKFIVIIHGMKSSLGLIGETQLSELAANLERESRNNNLDYVNKFASRFLEELQLVLERIIRECGLCANDTDKNLDDLREKLLAIQEMCRDYNRKGALDVISEIVGSGCSKETRAVLDGINEFIQSSDFEKAEGAAAEYGKKINTIKI
jgi:CheY-like chemotaxis protein